jgi:putative phosphonate transport system ATP-binding protein
VPFASREMPMPDGGRTGCAGVSFDLWPGEVLGVVGESGSGKTTLLNCLAGLMGRVTRWRWRSRSAAC